MYCRGKYPVDYYPPEYLLATPAQTLARTGDQSYDSESRGISSSGIFDEILSGCYQRLS